MATSKVTLKERAILSRKIARSHRQMAREAVAVAERFEREAALMDRGIDPHATNPCSDLPSPKLGPAEKASPPR